MVFFYFSIGALVKISTDALVATIGDAEIDNDLAVSISAEEIYDGLAVSIGYF